MYGASSSGLGQGFEGLGYAPEQPGYQLGPGPHLLPYPADLSPHQPQAQVQPAEPPQAKRRR